MTARWPGTLPDFILVDGYGERPLMPRASFPTDVGPPIERPRGTYRMRECACQTILNAKQIETFEEWVIRDLGQGVVPFIGNHPRTGKQVTMKFRADENGQVYSLAPRGSFTAGERDYTVSFTLLVLGA